MDRFRPHKSPGSERFIGVLSSSSPSSSSSDADAAEEGFELHEDELFASAPSPPEPTPRPPHSAPVFLRNPNPNPNPSPLSPSRRPAFRRPTDGILAALPEDFTRFSPKHGAAAGASLLRPRPHLSSSSSSSASTSPTSSASSSASRMIPSIPRPRPEFTLSVPGGRIHHQSAPVNVPLVNRRPASGPEELEEEEDGDGEDEMLPPHEIVARARTKESPLRASSMLEGAGRTLKGRDQCQVRDAIWSKMGFMD